jgi:hypothetical protein
MSILLITFIRYLNYKWEQKEKKNSINTNAK